MSKSRGWVWPSAQRHETFYGLAGVGDVVTTCYSPYGRNRSVGERIGRGESLDEVLGDMVNVAEGVPTTRSVYRLALERGVDMPITAELHQILFEGKDPRGAVTAPDGSATPDGGGVNAVAASQPGTCAVAFKEWSGVCDALADGRQSILLRKGGIREEPGAGRFVPEHREFWLYPTGVHQAAAGPPAHGRTGQFGPE